MDKSWVRVRCLKAISMLQRWTSREFEVQRVLVFVVFWHGGKVQEQRFAVKFIH